MRVRYELLARSSTSQARRGRLHTNHGVVETPVFMPVGTVASVKALDTADLEGLGAQIILGNTYHLMLRPGSDRVQRLGGLHCFMDYGGAILTDSGGFQVFSLAALRKLTDHGVTFRSHIDGTAYELTPERAVQIQEQLGSDIAMALDECPPANASHEHVARSLERTTAWAKRCLAARQREDVSLFGITQGAVYDDLRLGHAAELCALPFDGFAIGGVSVGESAEDIDRVVKLVAPKLPEDKPRYLMGVGTPEDLVRGVAAGVDMFDCVMPTRNARNGQLFTFSGRLNIKGAAFTEDERPIDPEVQSPASRYSRAYLRHLYVSKELAYYRLATLHNLAFYLTLMARLRDDIAHDRFSEAEWLARLRGPQNS